MKLLIIFGLLSTIGLVSSSGIPLTSLVRSVPDYSTTVYQSNPFGANFAYSTFGGHGYKALTPYTSSHFYPQQLQYYYQNSPVFSTYPLAEQVIFDSSNFSPLAPIKPIEIPTQPASPEYITPSESHGTAIDDDSIAVDSA